MANNDLLTKIGIIHFIETSPNIPKRTSEILLRHFQGVSTKELATLYDLTPVRIKQIIENGIRIVRRYILQIDRVQAELSRLSEKAVAAENKISAMEFSMKALQIVGAPLERLYELPIEDLELSVRVYNALKYGRKKTIGDIMNLSEYEFLKMHGVGKKSAKELSYTMKKIFNLTWPVDKLPK